MTAWTRRCFSARGRLTHKKGPLWVRALNPSISAISPFSKLCFFNTVGTCWESTASFCTWEFNFHRERTSSLLLICVMLFQSFRYITAHTSFRKLSKVNFTQPYSCAVLKHICRGWNSNQNVQEHSQEKCIKTRDCLMNCLSYNKWVNDKSDCLR